MKHLQQILLLSGLATVLQGCALFSAAGLSSQGQPTKLATDFSQEYSVKEVIDHSDWDALLKKNVDEDGFVDYKGFTNEKSKLEEYLTLLSVNPPQESWTVEELLAYYINTYNAYTVKLIIDNYPVKSIKDINGPWTKAIVPIGNKNLSLGGIENGILRKMNEPRIHFAINCASYSCPILLNEAFVPNRINEQLDKVTKDFINGNKNELTAETPKLSRIFDWYRKDFEVNGKTDVIAYINQFSEIQIKDEAEISYLEYNWDLNESN